METKGCVYLVGAGPGDPGLLTVRAAELIASAGAIVCDGVVSPRVLTDRPDAAEVVYVRSPGGEDAATTAEIVRRIVDLARRHSRVVRLMSGDPFMFSRGGEEALALKSAGVPFEVVPGVTEGIATPSYAGIPVTHRGTAGSVAFIDDRVDAQGAERARGQGTVVLYTEGARLEASCRRLIVGGRAADTPAAVIERGTQPGQRTVVGTLETLPKLAKESGIAAPAIAVVGGVVALRDPLAWYERRPLFGYRVVVTRAQEQAGEFAAALARRGADVIPFPTIRIEAPEDPEPLRRAVREVAQYDWLVFTSVNGVKRFWAELRVAGRDTRALGGVSICAVGAATAAALEAQGAGADLVPGKYVAEGVVEALSSATDVRGRRVLLARAEVGRSALPESLRALGALVDDVVAYRTVRDGTAAQRVALELSTGAVDLITFTAGSTVRNFVELVGTEIGRAIVASIGPITSASARGLGLPVHVEASEHTISGLLAAIDTYLRESSK